MVQLTIQLAHRTRWATLDHAEIVAQGALEINKKNEVRRRSVYSEEILKVGVILKTRHFLHFSRGKI